MLVAYITSTTSSIARSIVVVFFLSSNSVIFIIMCPVYKQGHTSKTKSSAADISVFVGIIHTICSVQRFGIGQCGFIFSFIQS